MWILQDKQNGSWSAIHYTTVLVNGKIARETKIEVEGTKRQALDFLLSFRDKITLSDVRLACEQMDETDDDTAYFGVMGGFITTGNEIVLATA